MLPDLSITVQLDPPPHGYGRIEYLDIETLDWFRPEEGITEPVQLTFGIAWTLKVTELFSDPRNPARWRFWSSASRRDLAWYLKNTTLVTFNGIHFDWPIIRHGLDHPALGEPRVHFDLFDLVRVHTGRWIGLDALARANGLAGKTAGWTGKKAAEALREARESSEVAMYCKNDVQLLYDLVAKWDDGGFIVVPPKKPDEFPIRLTLAPRSRLPL